MARLVAGKYRLIRKLASGGMGEVFLAVQTGPQGIEKRVVLKKVLAEKHGDKESEELFLAEARVAADLHHPNVVDVYEVGVDGPTLFIAMEFLDGWDLRRVQNEAELARRPMPLGPALQVIADVARGLHHAHEKRAPDGRPLRIVHRDVSPHNVVITRHGVAKILDFGIAKADLPRGEVTDPRLVKGKISYMSPEQVSGGPLDHRSDLYSLGIVLYEITTLSRVFPPESLDVLVPKLAMAKIAPPSSVLPDYPKKLEGLVLTALAARPSQRFQTGEEMAGALEEFLDESAIPHSPSKVARYLRGLFGDEDSIESVRFTEEPTVPQPAAALAEAPASLSAPAPTSEPLPWDPAEEAPEEERALLDALRLVLDQGDRARLTNAAEPEDEMIGRDAEVAAVAALLAGTGTAARLVTLHGPGGVGKTRMALRLATRLAGEPAFRSGAWFVDLASVTGVDGLCGAVGAVLGVPVTGVDGVAQLGRALAGRGRLLLVLDGFEPLISQAEEVVGHWLRAAPEACFLVTSREPLRLSGEHVQPVEPLPLPAEGERPESSPAVQLFLQRARRARPTFEPGGDDWRVVVKIVEQLDGLPLALELAAARLSVLTPEKMLSLFPKRFELLRDTRGGTRRPTLKGVLDASWETLHPWEQDAFAQVAAFRGSFDLAAAEAVIDLSAHADAPWTLDVVQSLVEKSLLRAAQTPLLPGEPRFSMYASVREYAQEKLEAHPGVSGVLARHAAWYLHAAAEWAGGVDAHGGLERWRRLTAEMENLQAVLERAVAAPRSPDAADRALRAAIFLEPVLGARGPLPSLLGNLDAALASAEGQPVPPRALAQALLARGRARRLCGRIPEALGDLGQALRQARAAGDRGLVAEILNQTGSAELARGDVDASRQMHEEAHAIAVGCGDRMREALAEAALAALPTADAAGANRAGERFRRALALLRALGSRRQTAAVLGNYGIFLRQQGRFDEAAQVEQEALARYRELGDRVFEGNKLGTLAGLHMDAGHPAEARRLYEEALQVTRAVGNRRSEGIFSGNAGILAHLDGRMDEARAGYERAVEILDEVGDRRLAALYRAYLAAVLADTDHPVAAERMLDAARAAIGETGAADPLLEAAADLLAVHLELARARRGNASEARAFRESARQRLAETRRSELDRQNEDVRLAARLLEQALERDGRA